MVKLVDHEIHFAAFRQGYSGTNHALGYHIRVGVGLYCGFVVAIGTARPREILPKDWRECGSVSCACSSPLLLLPQQLRSKQGHILEKGL